DNSTEKEVMAAIEGLSHQLTVILIAHRLSTLEKCDRIFQLDQGQVCQESKG
ncbi:multidrug ABC transporter ATP-binding protein, partial [Cylindrospermopsis raciborskii CS-506_A]|nr:multidrug ABC transporter ATP-binding protein [Cylindrospermopsis raciborskii CS-506_A]